MNGQIPFEVVSGMCAAEGLSALAVLNLEETASLHDIGACAGMEPPSPRGGSMPSSRSSLTVAPSMTRAAALAMGTPVALATNGTVREARGLASMT